MMRGERRWRLRVAIDDRPGALAALATTLGVHDIDVQRIDVVARDGVAVDDIWIELPLGSRIDSLEPVLRRLRGVTVRALLPVASVDDPVTVMAEACASVAGASDVAAAAAAAVGGVSMIADAEIAAFLIDCGDGALELVSAHGEFPAQVAAHEQCIARDAMLGGGPIVVPGAYPWAPDPWRMRAAAEWAAAFPVATTTSPASLLVVRTEPLPFERGEIARLAAFASTVAAAMTRLVVPEPAAV
jgi:hypothetical protein